MAHVAKYTRPTIGRLMCHYNREKDDGVTRSNESIDPERTEQNYFFKCGSVDELNKRLSQVKVCKRSDVNVMCDWVITLPKDVLPDDERKFFETSFNFLSERYGKDNIINAVVHKDETTPHMHCAFVPVVEDKKKGGYKVSAKECLNREELRSFHSDLSHYVQEQLGYEVAILNGATIEGNLTKKEMLENDIKGLEKQKEILANDCEELGERKETLANDCEELGERKETLANDCEELWERKETLANDCEELEERKETLANDCEELEERKKTLESEVLTAEEARNSKFKKCLGGGVKFMKKSGEVASTSESIDYIQSLQKTAKQVKSIEKENKQIKSERDEAYKKIEAQNDEIKELKTVRISREQMKKKSKDIKENASELEYRRYLSDTYGESALDDFSRWRRWQKEQKQDKSRFGQEL